jgi:hypothetical protein
MGLLGLGGVLAALTLAFVVLTGSAVMLTRRMRRIRTNTKVFGQLTRDTSTRTSAPHGAEARVQVPEELGRGYLWDGACPPHKWSQHPQLAGT